MIIVQVAGKNVGDIVFGQAEFSQIFLNGVGAGSFSKITDADIKEVVAFPRDNQKGV